ncbi:helix-turn-helix transcriptional regulator [Candidatus Sumerlaeota bacterium]
MNQLLKLQQLLIQRRRGVTKKEIAAILGKSTRQAERYLKQLEEAGVPIVADGEPQSGVARRWRIDRKGFRGMPQETPPISLNSSEFFVIAAAVESSRLPQCPWLDESRRSALETLSIYLPGKLSRRLPVLTAGLAQAGPHEGTVEDISQAIFEAVMDGIVRHRRLEVEYPWRSGKAKKRQIEPLGFLLAHGSLYCAVRICPHEDVRYLKLVRMKTAKVLDEEFDLPAEFDLRQHIEPHFSLWDEPAEKVEIRFDAKAAEAIRSRKIHPSQRIKELPDGGLILRMKVGGKWEVIWWLLSWGDRAELMKPNAWRTSIASLVNKMVTKYSGVTIPDSQ